MKQMKTKKINLSNVMGKLSRMEMRKIMGGDIGSCGSTGCTPGPYQNCPLTCPCTNTNLNWKCVIPPPPPYEP